MDVNVWPPNRDTPEYRRAFARECMSLMASEYRLPILPRGRHGGRVASRRAISSPAYLSCLCPRHEMNGLCVWCGGPEGHDCEERAYWLDIEDSSRFDD